MAGEQIAFRRAATGIPVPEISRHTDRSRLYLDWPLGQNQIVISSFSPEALGSEFGAFGTPVSATTWPTADQAIFVPFVVYNPLTIVKLGFYNGATASGNIDVGIYDEAGVLLVSAGSTAQAGTSGVQSFDVTDTALNPGLHYLAAALDNTTGTFQRPNVATVQLHGAMGILSMATAFPLPSTATMAAAVDVACPFILATQRTLI